MTAWRRADLAAQPVSAAACRPSDPGRAQRGDPARPGRLAAFAYGAAAGCGAGAAPQRRTSSPGLEAQSTYAWRASTGLGYGGRPAGADRRPGRGRGRALTSYRPAGRMPAASFLPMGGKRRCCLAWRWSELHAAAPTRSTAGPAGGGALRRGRGRHRRLHPLPCLRRRLPDRRAPDNPDEPALRFPGGRLRPVRPLRQHLPRARDQARAPPRLHRRGAPAVPIKEEAPFDCIRCGKPFGTRASIGENRRETRRKALDVRDFAAIERIRMCDDCRVIVQSRRPTTRSGRRRPPPAHYDDYLRERGDRGRPRQARRRKRRRRSGA